MIREKLNFTEECHLVTVKGMTELENQRFVGPNETTDSRELDNHTVPKYRLTDYLLISRRKN